MSEALQDTEMLLFYNTDVSINPNYTMPGDSGNMFLLWELTSSKQKPLFAHGK